MPCNAECGCPADSFNPVCGDGYNFLSACHAGCTKGTNMVFNISLIVTYYNQCDHYPLISYDSTFLGRDLDYLLQSLYLNHGLKNGDSAWDNDRGTRHSRNQNRRGRWPR